MTLPQFGIDVSLTHWDVTIKRTKERVDLQNGGGLRHGDHNPPTNTTKMHLHVE